MFHNADDIKAYLLCVIDLSLPKSPTSDALLEDPQHPKFLFYPLGKELSFAASIYFKPTSQFRRTEPRLEKDRDILVKKFCIFYGSKISLQWSQMHATGSYPELEKSCLHLHTRLFQIHFCIFTCRTIGDIIGACVHYFIHRHHHHHHHNHVVRGLGPVAPFQSQHNIPQVPSGGDLVPLSCWLVFHNSVGIRDLSTLQTCCIHLCL
jgi:hypothetical protein